MNNKSKSSEGSLSQFEQGFIEAIESARVFVPPDCGDDVVIRADLIRKILLNIDVARDSDSPHSIKVTSFGIRIGCATATAPAGKSGWHNAPRTRIEGVLDLAGLGPFSNGQPIYLELEWCDFDHYIDLSNATLSHLSLCGSRFGALRLDNARIEGALDLRQCGPRAKELNTSRGGTTDQSQTWPFAGNPFLFDDQKEDIGWVGASATPSLLATDEALSPCIVRARDARIAGSILMDCSDFCHEQDSCSALPPSREPLKSALDFNGMQVEGHIQLQQSAVIGTFNLASARIGGDVWLSGSRLLTHNPTESPKALNLQHTRIGGLLAMRVIDSGPDHRQDFERNIVFGQIFGIGLQAGSIWFECGLFVTGLTQREPAFLFFKAANIAESVRFGPYHSSGQESVGADWCRIEGALFLEDITIGGTLQVGRVNGYNSNKSQTSGHEENAPAGHYVSQFDLNKSASCWINARQATIRQDINIMYSQLGDSTHQGNSYAPPAIDAYKASISTGFRIDIKSQCHGLILLNHASVHLGVSIACNVQGACQKNSRTPIAVDLSETEVLGNIDIGTDGSNRTGSANRCDNQITLKGSLLLANTRVHGSVLIGKVKFEFDTKASEATPIPELDEHFTYRQGVSFADADIAGALEVGEIEWSLSNSSDSADANNETENTEPYQSLTKYCRDDKYKMAVFRLPFYKDVLLIEILNPEESKVRRILWDKQNRVDSAGTAAFVVIDGSAAPIHALNGRLGTYDVMREDSQKSRLRLDERAKCEAYLAFFCDSIQADDGPFKIQEFLNIDDATNQLKRTLSPKDNPELSTVIRARLLYGEHVFNASFELDYRGRVAMLEDNPIGEEKGTPNDEFSGFWRPILDNRFTAFDYRSHESSGRYHLHRLRFALTQARLRSQIKQRFTTPYCDLRRDQSAVALNLQGLKCGSLKDDFGRNWHLGTHRVILQAAGIHIDRLEAATASQSQDYNSLSPGTGSKPAHTGSLGKHFDDKASKGAGSYSPKEHTRRLIWLTHQTPFQPKRGDHDYLRGVGRMVKKLLPLVKWPSRMMRWYRTFDKKSFIPQVYDRFALAHIEAGEVSQGYEILREKKDIASAIRLRGTVRLWWGRSFARCDTHSENQPERKSRRIPYGFLLLALGVIALLVQATLLEPGSTWESVLIYMAWTCLLLALWPVLEAIFMLLFSVGFQYGLSARRALLTFGLCILFGAVMTHIGRTGSLFPPADWADLAHGELAPGIAIVLDVPYQAQAQGIAPITSVYTSNSVLESRLEPRIAGETLIARALPCNPGIDGLFGHLLNNFVYALDNFVPLIDLNHARHCSIRKPAARADGTLNQEESTAYYAAWYLGKALYIALGWIVTSLMLLTVSGIMKRDLER
ncbi:hypothetical protein [Kushneria phosphatilytica]|uniref:Uncharacterized protein n=1 Tax=Kushneria phosphatilytica TaxID=657387 RepID=A0A1S1P1G5_9GAMM|nr:hypothetical protein [Kushneria phosphatilytica]OHV13897.1 hypothetical protein BH688_00685 [Kushneria phosphatilytica]QEL10457.1 hypothetical protein FY550_04430 [Kushneria phosphatilytica]